MATTIGRVEFIADLDGSRLPKQAEAINDKIEKQGKLAGKRYAKGFGKSFDEGLTVIGKRTADRMLEAGDLSAMNFSKTFDQTIKQRFSKTQRELADLLSDQSAFDDYAKNFTDIDAAVKSLEDDLTALNAQNGKYVDSQKKVHKVTILTKDAMKSFQAEARRMGKQSKLNEQINLELAAATEKLDADTQRMMRTIGDATAFEKASESVGGTSIKYAELRAEIEGLNEQGHLSLAQMEKSIDMLDRTREAVDKKAEAERNATKAADDHSKSLAALDKLLADIDSKMGDSASYKKYVESVGSATEANDRLRASFKELEDMGESQQSLSKMERQLQKVTLEFDKGAEGSTRFSKAVDKSMKKVEGSFRRMQGSTKAIVGLILSAGDQIAVLGSALGAGLVGLGAILQSFLVGVLAGVAVFGNLGTAMADATDEMKPMITEFNIFKKVLDQTGDAIAEAGFEEMNGSFILLSNTVRALTPALEEVGAALGKLTKQFALSVQPGTEMFEELETAIEQSIPQLESLIKTVGRFGAALVRAFNDAGPLVEQLLNWLDDLSQQFYQFTNSTNFDVWVSNAVDVFDELGDVIDELGQAFDELASPEAFDRTVQFLDDLESAIDPLGELLEVFGGLNIIGVIANLLAEFGQAILPMLEPLQQLTQAVGEAMMAFADGISVLEMFATVAAPVITALAAIVDAVPLPVWTALSIAVTAYAASLLSLKVVGKVSVLFGKLSNMIWPLISNMVGLTASTNTLSVSMSKVTSSGRGMVGVIGAVTAAAIAGINALADWAYELSGIEGETAKVIDSQISLVEYIDYTSGAAEGASQAFTDVDEAFAHIEDWQGNVFENIGAAFSDTTGQAHSLNAALNELDEGMQGLPLEEQAELFKGWANELGATDEQILLMLESMPLYKESLEQASAAAGDLATGQDLVNIAMEGLVPSSNMAIEGFDALAESSGITLHSIEDLTDVIRGLSDTELDARDATREYQASIDDLTASVEENGATLDITTEAGRSNEEQIDKLAEATKENSAAILENTGSQELATDAMEEGRAELIRQLEQFGITGEAAEQYADDLGLVTGSEASMSGAAAANKAQLQLVLEQFGLTGAEADEYSDKLLAIDPEVLSEIELDGTEEAVADAESVKKSIDRIESKTVNVHTRFTSEGEKMASGGILAGGARHIIAGEAGPEAIVPLNRPLNQVDPAVRALSAFAQGFSQIPMAAAGAVATGEATPMNQRILSIQPGAIVVQGVTAPEATASMVVNRIAERVVA